MSDSTSLYRHFAADGSLLYVGVSLSWPARTKAHARSARWFDLVSRVEIEKFPTRIDALAAERSAIKSERPKFNVVHNAADAAPRKREQRIARRAPLLPNIHGPDAIVGPALIYRDDKISLMIAHGKFGTEGELTEVLLGDHFPDLPEWTDACDTVLTLRQPGEITLEEARGARGDILRSLMAYLDNVQAYDTDIALATAYATQFPSDKSRRVLDEVAVDRRCEVQA